MTLKRKLFTAISMFALTCAMLLVGVWAVSSTSIEIGGTISFLATNVNATVSGSITGTSSGTITPTTLEYSSSKTPTTEALNTWKNNLSFDEEGSKITMTITVNNLSSERKLYVTLTDTVGDVTNLSKTVKNGENTYTSGTRVEIAISGTATFTIEFIVGSTDISMDGSYGYTMKLKDENATPEASELSYLTFSYNEEDSTASITGSTGDTPTDLTLPTTIINNGKEYRVTSIGDRAFKDGRLVSISLPDSLISIGEFAFGSNNHLKIVRIPKNVTSIGYCVLAYGGLNSLIIDSEFIASNLSVTMFAETENIWKQGATSGFKTIYIKSTIEEANISSFIKTYFTSKVVVTDGEYAGYSQYSR